MASMNFLVLFSAVSVVRALISVGDEGLVLLQTHAQESRIHVAEARDVQHLPTLGEVMSRPKSVFEKMSSRVGELEKRLAEEQRREAVAIASEKAELEQELSAQREENREIHEQNSKLSAHIKRAKVAISKLRRNASTLRKLNADLVNDLKALETNISTAQEYITESLDKSTDMLENAQELDVLRELQERDDRLREEAVHAQRLQVVSHSNDLALLETNSESRYPTSAQDTRGLLEMLSSALSDLSKEHNNSQTMLREEFAKEHQKAAERRVALLTEQEQLNSTLTSLLDVKAQLTVAVAHLQKTHGYLAGRAHSLRAFATRVGARATPEGAEITSLLQLGSNTSSRSKKMPDVKSILKRPIQTLDLVNSQVAELQQRLAAANQQSILEAQGKKSEYDGILLEMEHNNSALRRKNKQLSDDISHLDRSIRKLRNQTQDTMKSNDKLRAELKLIQANISLMQEFLEKSLEATNESLSGTPDLQVLAELEAQERAEKLENVHARSLEQISPEKMALLQFDNLESVKTLHQELLNSLSQAMDKLTVDQEGSLQQLKEAFEKDFEVKQQRHQKLENEFLQLNATKVSKQELEHRLQVALAHLEQTGLTLTKRRSSLLGYAARLVDRPQMMIEEAAGDRIALKQSHRPNTHEREHGSKYFVSNPADITRGAKTNQSRSSAPPLSRKALKKSHADGPSKKLIVSKSPRSPQKSKIHRGDVKVSKLSNQSRRVKPQLLQKSAAQQKSHNTNSVTADAEKKASEAWSWLWSKLPFFK